MHKAKELNSSDLQELLGRFDVDAKKGLSSKIAEERLDEYGSNRLTEKTKRGWVATFFLQFLSPLIYLLLFVAIVMLYLDRIPDAIVVIAVVLLNAIMGTIQEGRAERSLSALLNLSKIHARVLRDGHEKQIDSQNLVPGDILHLIAGDAVPADCRILEEAGLEVVEAVLTGEAEGVIAREGTLYSGTYISKGRCLGLVIATGPQTEMGKIAAIAESKKSPKTPIERRIETFGKYLSIAAVIVFLLLLGIGFLEKIPPFDIFMSAISQLVSLIPEGLPAAITIGLAIGVNRMAAQGAIIRRLVAVETLGSTTVICTDKTGTLTRGEMEVVDVALPGQSTIKVQGAEFFQSQKSFEPQENNALYVLLEAAVLCNDAKLEPIADRHRILGDPMEGALLVLARKAQLDDRAIVEDFPRKLELPFDATVKMMATCHEGVVMIKGAMESVLGICGSVLIDDEEKTFTKKLRSEIEEAAKESASHGHRILAFARFDGDIEESTGFSTMENRALFLGFVTLVDPPREEAFEAVKVCHAAGIRTMMLTGDHFLTAKAIATQLGIMGEILEGTDLDKMSDEELASRINKIGAFARLHPIQKLRIVEALQKQGEVVAMTGDGVNDAPALAKADVGIAMGKSGTDVAKEAAKMVITDDNFATIVKAVEQGRLVYKNIKKVLFYLLATNCAAAALVLLAVTFGLGLPIAAVQILWINIVTEGTMTVNLVFDPPEGNEMRLPPAKKTDKLFSGESLVRLIYIMVVITAILLGYYIFMRERGTEETLLQTQMFTLLAFCAWFKMISGRSDTQSSLKLNLLKNRSLAFWFGVSILLQAAVVYLPVLNDVFHTVPLPPRTVLLLLVLGSIVLWVEEIRKWLFKRKN